MLGPSLIHVSKGGASSSAPQPDPVRCKGYTHSARGSKPQKEGWLPRQKKAEFWQPTMERRTVQPALSWACLQALDLPAQHEPSPQNKSPSLNIHILLVLFVCMTLTRRLCEQKERLLCYFKS